MKISVVGLGYVGLSNALVLAQKNEVYAYDILPDKIDLLSNGVSPIFEPEIENFLAKVKSNFHPTSKKQECLENADYIIIATPTDYDPVSNSFDTSTIEDVLESISQINNKAIVVIKSTIPLGYTTKIAKKYSNKIIFAPEFLREGKALEDSLYPSRIVAGGDSMLSQSFTEIMKKASYKNDVPILITGSTEAEAIKLFSNSYLAMRVAFFNELDMYAETSALSAVDIIKGVGLDSRIGEHYNNPSFGYGGYCLPKDTKQLKANYSDIPNTLISAIVDSNKVRKDFVADNIARKKPKTLGVYKLAMKAGSDNFRSSSIIGVIRRLEKHKIRILVYEPWLSEEDTPDLGVDFDLIESLDEFKQKCDLIITNRMSSELEDIKEKIYTRDLFGIDM
mgnify:CR=1 FL=1